jgi:MtN3 and saliva related transmembrane protein
MINLEVLGFLAGLFSVIAFFLQVHKTWKMKSAKGVSIYMFMVYTMSILLWIIYGIIIDNRVIYITNIIVLTLSITQIIFKIKYDKQEKKIKELEKI